MDNNIRLNSLRDGFISYSRKDINCMEAIRVLINSIKPDANIFIDSLSIRGGDKWENEIYSALKRCDTLFIVWSWNSSVSEWVKKEIAIAIKLQELNGIPKIIPICMDDTPLKFGLDRYQSVPFPYSESKKNSLFDYLLTGMIGGAGYYGINYFHHLGQIKIISIILIIYVWIATILFIGLRGANAPWNRYKNKLKVSVLFGTISIQKTPATLLFLMSLINVGYSSVILFI